MVSKFDGIIIRVSNEDVKWNCLAFPGTGNKTWPVRRIQLISGSQESAAPRKFIDLDSLCPTPCEKMNGVKTENENGVLEFGSDGGNQDSRPRLHVTGKQRPVLCGWRVARWPFRGADCPPGRTGRSDYRF